MENARCITRQNDALQAKNGSDRIDSHRLEREKKSNLILGDYLASGCITRGMGRDSRCIAVQVQVGISFREQSSQWTEVHVPSASASVRPRKNGLKKKSLNYC